MIFLVVLLFVLGLVIGMIIGVNLPSFEVKADPPKSMLGQDPYSKMQDVSEEMYYSNGVHKHNPMLDR